MYLLRPQTVAKAEKVEFSEVQKIIDTRCVTCHAEKPTFQGFAEAPTDERVKALCDEAGAIVTG